MWCYVYSALFAKDRMKGCFHDTEFSGYFPPLNIFLLTLTCSQVWHPNLPFSIYF